jgi:hypothetical protein
MPGLLTKPEVVEVQGQPLGRRRDGPVVAGFLYWFLVLLLALVGGGSGYTVLLRLADGRENSPMVLWA